MARRHGERMVAALSMEELAQKGYLTPAGVQGKRFGDYEVLDIGATSVARLAKAGLDFTPASSIPFSCERYKAPKNANLCKPDSVYVERVAGRLVPIAVAEWKDKAKLKRDDDILAAAEQAVVGALAMGVRLALTTDGERYRYIDAAASADAGKIIEIPESRDFNPSVLSDLHRGESDVERDPRPLSETVWQIIWHATKAEPKDCLLTFVEIFMLKFLSDNLPLSAFPKDYRFDVLLKNPDEFKLDKGISQIEYYVRIIRPRIKEIFAERLVVDDDKVRELFGMATITSHTSIINGFAFLKSSPTTTISSYNRVFCEILEEFQEYGSLTNIDKEFKLRLYETFLKRSARQQRLGQFFTPRNIVKPMVKMAQLNALPEGAVVLDPAAGVGGFLLEPLLFPDALPGNVTFDDGKPKQRVKLVGVDVDASTNILAKANMLLHLAESVRDSQTTPEALNQTLTNTFLLMNENETLGSLLYPPQKSVDVILTNPPYVTQGSAIYRKELEHLKGKRNGTYLESYYDTGGLGVEALFLRYISGALKPGGRAFVIVPLGLLNRTAQRMKKELLRECNILASLQLPRNAFFNTAQPTYILVLEKRRVEKQSRPPVFCGIARSIGETLDHERVPTPGDNDLAMLADLFVRYSNSGAGGSVTRPTTYADCLFAKLVPASEFAPDERWDVIRHWTDSEHVELGERSETIDRSDFIDLATETLQELIDDLRAAKEELAELQTGPNRTFSLADSSRFQVRSGIRIRNVDLRENPGDVPVYSVFTRPETVKGYISREWLLERGVEPEPYPSVTVMATGASAVGTVFYREANCVMTDDVVIVQSWPKGDSDLQLTFEDNAEDIAEPVGDKIPEHEIDLAYLAVALSQTIAQGGYLYEAKLYTKRVAQLSIEVPVDADGNPDIDRQKQIAAVAKRLDQIRSKLQETGAWSKSVRLA
ncbi:N-6 DNA methylase [Streptomyces rochei]|uniref:N-6 DNA methylase n=1 Tax=Streptomyces TaxID=1883 RepID=UPI001C230051|nr:MULTISPECIES: N-6 DNA methylase [unclassified Streptomyces]MBU8551935.1 N-6 DNA methylase [Streptomyces sp. Osf17]MBU8558713.1 N-6 DNA methylase [Streptomyces sp. Babs14]